MRKLKLGVAGLGRAFSLLEETFTRDPRICLLGGADLRADAAFPGKRYRSVEELCRSPEVEVVYVATPHQFHAEHACLAAAAGKHVLVEKPMALSLEECEAMIAAARAAGVRLVVGPSHGFDAPVRHARKLIASGGFGRLRMITSLNFTDFLYRPRRPEELDTARGGGVAYNQAPHQIDVLRVLGGELRSLRSCTGVWDRDRPTEGAYAALLSFKDGAFATLTYSGYAHFDSDELMGWIGEMGGKKDPSHYGRARKALKAGDEASLKYARKRNPQAPVSHPHFGLVIASCEHADLRVLPDGVMIYGDEEKRFEPVPLPAVPRAEVIDELYDAVALRKPIVHDGAWGRATLEACLALLRSAKEGKEIPLRHQSAIASPTS